MRTREMVMLAVMPVGQRETRVAQVEGARVTGMDMAKASTRTRGGMDSMVEVAKAIESMM